MHDRLSKKSWDSDSMLSMHKVALALIRATWMKDAKQFLMLSVLQNIVLGSVLGAVLPWGRLFQVGVLLWEDSRGFLDWDRLWSLAQL